MNEINFGNLYQEYADQCAVENGDLYNTDVFGRHLARSSVFEPIDKLRKYEQRILVHALADLKNRQEWRDLEADDIRHGTAPGMRHMGATSLLERYRTEQWYLAQIAECDAKIAEIKTWKTENKSKANRLSHWTGRHVMLEMCYAAQIKKTDRYERVGHGNKYGFNPNMQSRETATGIFED